MRERDRRALQEQGTKVVVPASSAGRIPKAPDPVAEDVAVVEQVDEADLEVEVVLDTAVDLDAVSKKDLLALAKLRGVKVASRWTKAEIVAALEE